MVSNKIQIISCIISVASIFISYFLGRLESKRKYISSVKKIDIITYIPLI